MVCILSSRSVSFAAFEHCQSFLETASLKLCFRQSDSYLANSVLSLRYYLYEFFCCNDSMHCFVDIFSFCTTFHLVKFICLGIVVLLVGCEKGQQIYKILLQ